MARHMVPVISFSNYNFVISTLYFDSTIFKLICKIYMFKFILKYKVLKYIIILFIIYYLRKLNIKYKQVYEKYKGKKKIKRKEKRENVGNIQCVAESVKPDDMQDYVVNVNSRKASFIYGNYYIHYTYITRRRSRNPGLVVVDDGWKYEITRWISFQPFRTRTHISLYLKPKVLGHKLPCNVVEDTQLYGPNANSWQLFNPENHPWILSQVSSGKFEKVANYVFVNLTKKANLLVSNAGRENFIKKAGCGT